MTPGEAARVDSDLCLTESRTQTNIPERVVIEEVNDLQGLEALRQAWTQLLTDNSSATFFLSWEWQQTWWKHLASRHVPRIIILKRKGELIGIAPFAITPAQRRSMRLFRTLGYAGRWPVGADYLDVLARRGEETVVIEALADHLACGRDVIRLSHVAAKPCPAFNLVKSLEQKGWQVVSHAAEVCFHIYLEGHSWDSYLASLGATHRRNVRHRLRKMHREFDVEFVEAKSQMQRRDSMHEFELLHQKRWGEMGGAFARMGPQVMCFHDEFSRFALERGWLRLYLLRLDGKPAACVYGFYYDNVFYYYQAGFDPAFARYSVGLTAMAMSIQAAIEEGAHCFDMLHGAEAYKQLWANGQQPLVAYDCYPPGARGALARQIEQTRSTLKAMIGKPSAPSRNRACFDVADRREFRRDS